MFENFLVDPKTLLVTGSGWHSYATNRCTYQVSGKYQVETKEILFTEVYTNNNKEQVTIYYKGKLNLTRSAIEGEWGHDESCWDGGSFMI